jgi:hypothetical protein
MDQLDDSQLPGLVHGAWFVWLLLFQYAVYRHA